MRKLFFLSLLFGFSAWAGKDSDPKPIGTLVYQTGGSPPAVAGAEGVASSVNAMVGMMDQHIPAPDFSDLHSQVAATQSRIEALEAQRIALDLLFQRYNTPEVIAESKAVEARVQAFQAKTTTDRIALASDKWIINKVSTGDYGSLDGDFGRELGTWTTYSANRRTVLTLADKYSETYQRLRSTTLTGEVQTYSEIALQSGLRSLTEAAQIEGGHGTGSFTETLHVSEAQLEIAKGLLDLGLSMTPGVSVGKDAYEALTGKSLIDGSELDFTSRSFAVLGVATVGGSNVIKSSLKGLVKVGKAFHTRGLLGHGFSSAIHFAESGITDIVKHTSLSVMGGPLHLKEIPGTNGPMKFVSDTFRSGTYYSYKTTEPLTLYRAAGSNIADDAAHMSGYWTRVKPTGGTHAMIDSALDLSWKNNATKWVEITVPSGETLFEGIAASIPKGGHYTSEFIGGGNQIYINKTIPSEWIQQVRSF